jgi:CRP-like cAMP-binding protein
MSLEDEDLKVARGCELFRGMPEPVVRQLLSSRRAISLHKGQILFHQGDPALAFFVVLEGWMKIYRTGADGVETIIHVAKAGETFAEAAMFMEGAYPVHAEAITPTRLLRIEGRSVHERIGADPSFALAMLAAMSLRLRELVNEIERLKRHDATERVAEFLLNMAAASDVDPTIVTLPFEKLVIAARLGIKPESFSRALARLKAAGVATNGPQVTIASRQALEQFLKDSSSKTRSDHPNDLL